MLALTTPGYLSALQRYRGALVRRNAALRDAVRSPHGASATVAVWEPALAEHGATLLRARLEWVAESAARFEALCDEIGERGRARIRYSSSVGVERADAAAAELRTALAAALESKRGLDVKRGLTHAGPHRDDVALTLDGRDLRTFGSAGQQRTAAIALRMLEAATFSERTGRAPVFLLDDPFAELDVRRAARILAMLTGGLTGGLTAGGESAAGSSQTILAVPRASDIPTELTRLARVRVAGGAIERFTGE